MTLSEKTQRIKEFAKALGFDKIGIAPAAHHPNAFRLEQWLADGKHGTMEWMVRHSEIRKKIQRFFPDAQSVIVVALNYFTPHAIKTSPQTAKISRYAWGSDYHKILKKKLKKLLQQLKELDAQFDGRAFVDSAPVMEKHWAVVAGIGWQGKNTNVLTREFGSWIFLGGLAVNQKLEYDQPARDFCGTCNACVEACPTQALQPYQLDARKCISYLTIEYPKPTFPEDLSAKLNNWVFGCDICQDVCPWNRFAKETNEPRFHPKQPLLVNPPLNTLAQLDEPAFNRLFAGTPVRRARYPGFKRNVQAILTHQNP